MYTQPKAKARKSGGEADRLAAPPQSDATTFGGVPPDDLKRYRSLGDDATSDRDARAAATKFPTHRQYKWEANQIRHPSAKAKARASMGKADEMAAPCQPEASTFRDPPSKKCHQVLHLFSGPSPRKDGLASYLRAVDIGNTDVVIVNEHLEDQDLTDDAVWT